MCVSSFLLCAWGGGAGGALRRRPRLPTSMMLPTVVTCAAQPFWCEIRAAGHRLHDGRVEKKGRWARVPCHEARCTRDVSLFFDCHRQRMCVFRMCATWGLYESHHLLSSKPDINPLAAYTVKGAARAKGGMGSKGGTGMGRVLRFEYYCSIHICIHPFPSKQGFPSSDV